MMISCRIPTDEEYEGLVLCHVVYQNDDRKSKKRTQTHSDMRHLLFQCDEYNSHIQELESMMTRC